MDDVIVWPDDTWCYREQLHEMQWMSDDYVVLKAYSPQWFTFLDAYEPLPF